MKLGPNYDKIVLPSLLHDILKSIVGQYNASQMPDERIQISKTIRQALIERAIDYNIIVDDVAIISLSFNNSINVMAESNAVSDSNSVDR